MSYTDDFINKIKPFVIKDSLKKNIIPSIVISQACLESNWGRSELSVKHNNFFGVKDFSGKGSDYATTEYRNGKKITEQANFKNYTNLEEAISDHTDIFLRVKLGTGLRYQKVLKAKNFVDGARALQSCGYATDPEYANKIISICRSHDLGLVDREYFDGAKVVTKKKVVLKSSYINYTVTKGDSLSKICQTNDVKTLNEVVKLNGLINKDTIKIGQVLKIPSKLVK